MSMNIIDKMFFQCCVIPFLMVLMIVTPATARGPQSIAGIAEKLSGVVVNISTATLSKQKKPKKSPKIPKGSPFEDLFKDFFDKNGKGIPQKKVSSLGSGFVVHASGLIVTNNHVIEEADEIFVTFPDGEKLKVDRVVGRDKKTDLAVLKVTPSKPLEIAKFGNSEKLRIGDWVMAIGNPFGLGGTVTAGIISSKNRDINSGPYDNFIQTDAAINKGNSGGPLFNMEGEVIGVNTAIISPSGGSIGIGFAVPSDTAQNIIEQLIKNGKVRRGWLGVRIQSVSQDIAQSLGMENVEGALVSNVVPNSPAQKAGIKLGDVILAFDGHKITRMRQLPKIVSRSRIDQDVTVEFLRNQEKQSVILKIQGLDDEDDEVILSAGLVPEEKPAPKRTKQRLLNLAMSVMTSTLRKKFRIKKTLHGVVVTAVTKGSVADQKQIKVGQVIIEVSQNVVKKPSDVIEQVRKAKAEKRKSALFLISNGKGVKRFIALPVEKMIVP